MLSESLCIYLCVCVNVYVSVAESEVTQEGGWIFDNEILFFSI